MRESLVCFSHAVHFFALLHRAAATFRCIDQLTRQTHTHGFFTTLACSFAQPAHRQSHAARRTHFYRHLIIRTADAAALHFHLRLGIVQCKIEHLDRILPGLLANLLQCTVQNAFGNRFLAGSHQYIYKLGQILIAELRIRQDFALGDFSTSWHINLEMNCLKITPSWRVSHRTWSEPAYDLSRPPYPDCRAPCGSAHPANPLHDRRAATPPSAPAGCGPH